MNFQKRNKKLKAMRLKLRIKEAIPGLSKIIKRKFNANVTRFFRRYITAFLHVFTIIVDKVDII